MRKNTNQIVAKSLLLLITAISVLKPAFANDKKQERRDEYAYRTIIEMRAEMAKKAEPEWVSFAPVVPSLLAGGTEIAIWQLQTSNTAVSKRYLAYLNLVYLGSSTNEVLECASMEVGPKLLPHLAQAKKSINSGICLLPESGISGMQDYCNSKEEANSSIDNLVAMIKHGSKCEPDW